MTMKVTLDMTPSEAAEMIRRFGGNAEPPTTGGRSVTMAHTMSPSDDSGHLPGCGHCERYGDDRRRCLRANCEHSEANQSAKMGDVPARGDD